MALVGLVLRWRRTHTGVSRDLPPSLTVVMQLTFYL